MKKTVVQIKSELDDLGVEYKSSLRKADLVQLLAENTVSNDAEHYSPPYTRRKTMMTTKTTTVSSLDKSPINSASAVLKDLEEDIRKSDKIDVEITKEFTQFEERVLSTDMSGETSENSEDIELVEDIELNPDTTVTTRSITTRRSTHTRHVACEEALFSDGGGAEDDNSSTTSSVEARLSSRRRSLLIIFVVSVICAILANGVIYLHLHYPLYLQSILQRIADIFKKSEPSPEQ